MLLLMHIGSVGHRFCCCLQWCRDIISLNVRVACGFCTQHIGGVD